VEPITTADGLTLATYEWGTDHRGSAPPVVLHHGFAANAELHWVGTGVVAALVAAGRHVVALDARGHGASSTPHDPSFYGEELMAGDLSLLFDRLDTGHVHLVGYSMGAIVALVAAARDDRVERLVVGGVGAGVVELGGVDTRVLPNDQLVEALTATDPAAVAHEFARGFRAFTDAIGADRLALAAHARVVHASPIPLADVAAPTLLLAGRDDPLAVRPEVLAGAIPGARLQLVDGDHLGAVVDPSFMPAVIDFLAVDA
jgi:pimeloyl-ACP methyl ester carboxylesterase